MGAAFGSYVAANLPQVLGVAVVVVITLVFWGGCYIRRLQNGKTSQDRTKPYGLDET